MKNETVYITIGFRWWLMYLFLPMVIFTHKFAVNFISSDATVNQEWLEKWVSRGTYQKHKRTK